MAIVGTAYVNIRPTGTGFSTSLQAILERGANSAKVKQSGKLIGEAFGKGVNEGIERSVADSSDKVEKAGKKHSSAYLEGFRSSLASGLTTSINTALRASIGDIRDAMRAGGESAGRAFAQGLNSGVVENVDISKAVAPQFTAIDRDAQRAAKEVSRNFSRELNTNLETGAARAASRTGQQFTRSLARAVTGGGGGGGASAAASAAGANAAQAFSARFGQILESSLGQASLAAYQGFAVLFAKGAAVGVGLTQLSNIISSVIFSLYALGAAAVSAAAALGGILAASIGAAIQAGATLAVAFKGIGKAIGAGFDVAGKSTATATNNAKSIIAANRRVEDSALRIADAEEGVADARRRLADVYQSNSDRMADANRNVQSAERDLARSKGEVAAAQERLTRAMEEGREELEDLLFATEDAVLGQDRAAINLERAKAKLDAANAAGMDPSSLGYREIVLGYKEAELSMRVATDRVDDYKKANEEAARTGLKGTKAVSDAEKELASAKEGQIRAEERLADAKRARAKTERDNAKAVEDAQRAVSKALRNQERAVRDQKRAVDDLKDAQSGASGQLSEAAKAQNKYDEALKDLAPSAADFVKGIVGMQSSLKKLRKDIQAPFFDNFNESFFKLIDTYIPILRTQLAATSGTLGKAFAGIADSFTKNSDKVEKILKSNEKFLGVFNREASNGKTVIDNFTTAFINLGVALDPLLVAFGDYIEYLSVLASNKTSNVDKLKEDFTRFLDVLRAFKRVFSEIFGYFKELGSAAQPAALRILTYFENTFSTMKKNVVDNKDAFTTMFNDLADVAILWLRALGAIGRAFLGIEDGVVQTRDENGNLLKSMEEIPKAIIDSEGNLKEFFKQFRDSAPDVAEILKHISGIMKAISDSKSITAFFDTIEKAVTALDSLANSEVFQKLQEKFGTAFGIGKAIFIITLVGGLIGKVVLGSVLKVGKAVQFIFTPLLKLGGLILSPFKWLFKKLAGTSLLKPLIRGIKDLGLKLILMWDAFVKKVKGSKPFAKLFGGRSTTPAVTSVKDTEKEKSSAFQKDADKAAKKAQFVKISAPVRNGAVKVWVSNNSLNVKQAGKVAAGKCPSVCPTATAPARSTAAATTAPAASAAASTVGRGSGAATMEAVATVKRIVIPPGVVQAAERAMLANPVNVNGKVTRIDVSPDLKARAKAAGVSVGSDFGAGIWTGLDRAEAQVSVAASKLAKKMETSSKAAVRAKSPAVSAIEFAQFDWGGGLVRGLNNADAAVSAAARDLTNKVKTGAATLKADGLAAGRAYGTNLAIGAKMAQSSVATAATNVSGSMARMQSSVSGSSVRTRLSISGIAGGFRAIPAAARTAAVGIKGFFVSVKASMASVGIALLIDMIIMLIVTYLPKLVQKIKDFIKESGGVKEAWLRIWNKIKEVAQKVWDKVVGVFNGLVEWFKRNWVNVVVGLLTGPFGLAIKWIINNWDKVKEKFQTFKTWIKEKFSDVWGYIKEKAAGPLNGVIDLLNMLLSPLSAVVEFFTGKKLKIPRINTDKKASGGYVEGPGGPTDDRIPTLLSNGEYVIRASSVRKYGVGFFNDLNSGSVSQYRPIGPDRDPRDRGTPAGREEKAPSINDSDYTKKKESLYERIKNRVTGALGAVVDWVKSGAAFAIRKLFEQRQFAEAIQLKDSKDPKWRLIGGILFKMRSWAENWAKKKDEEEAEQAARDQRSGRVAIDPANLPKLGGWVRPTGYYIPVIYGVNTVRPKGHSTHFSRYDRVRSNYAIDFPGAGYGGRGPVLAANSGTIYVSEWSTGSSFGNLIMMRHANGYQSLYAHLARREKFAGMTVKAGDRIGTVGNTGGNFGVHLHFELAHRGTMVPIYDFLRGRGVKLASGGVVPSTAGGLLAVLGEGGRRERVEPLDSSGLSARDRAIISQLASNELSAYGGAAGSSLTSGVTVKVYIGDQELKNMINYEIVGHNNSMAKRIVTGRRRT